MLKFISLLPLQADTSNGEVIYSEVRVFLKIEPDAIVSYKTIKTLWNQALSLSGNHLIYKRKSGQGIFTPMWVSINILNLIAKDILSFRRITIDCLRSLQTFKSSFSRKVSFQICWSGFNWWWIVSSRALWI